MMGCLQSPVHWSFLKALALTESICMSMILLLGLFMIEAVFCIFSVKSVELVNALTYGGRSACEYPIDTYPRPLRVLFTVLAPFALTLHVPGSVILDKPLFDWPMWAVWVSPLSGIVFFILIRLCFRKAMRHYRSTGS